MSNSEKEKSGKNTVNAGISGAASETVQQHGSAVKEHLVAFSGKDKEAGTQLTKSLKSISEKKVNPEYQKQNLKQQAGFSAEVKETARANAEKIINRDMSRKVRTDDIGKVNDPLYDHIEIDATGKIINGSGSQMKFVGSNPNEAVKKLVSKEFSKYVEADAKIEVPSDFFDGINQELDAQIAKLQKQIDAQRAKGNSEIAAKLEKKTADYRKIKKNLRKSKVSTDDAMFARLHPKLSTAQDVVKVSHRAGVEAAQTAGIIGGSVSIVQNLVSVVKGDLEAADAAKNVAKDTGTSVAVGYGIGFVGSTVKGMMQNAGSDTVHTLSKTNLPAVVATVAISATKTMTRYFKGEINGLECFEELGEQGTGMLASSLVSVIGQAVIPIPVVGGLVGGMIGYAIASASYGTLLQALKDEKYAREERIRIEKACEEHIQMIRDYRSELESAISYYLVSNIELFHRSFDGIKQALSVGDIDGFISGTNAISSALGCAPQFETFADFDAIMNSDKKFKL